MGGEGQRRSRVNSVIQLSRDRLLTDEYKLRSQKLRVHLKQCRSVRSRKYPPHHSKALEADISGMHLIAFVKRDVLKAEYVQVKYPHL